MVQIDILYEGGLHCTATHQPSGETLATDAPLDNQGKGESFSPTDLVATALGTCIATTMDIHARRRDLDLTGLKITVQKEMTTTAPRKIAKLTTEIWFPLPLSADPERVLEKVAVTCPVHASLGDAVEDAGHLSLPGRKINSPVCPLARLLLNKKLRTGTSHTY